MAEVRAIPESFKNVTKVISGVFLRRFLIEYNRKRGVRTTAEFGMVLCPCPGQCSLCLRCWLPNTHHLLVLPLPAGSLGSGNSGMGWASSAQQCFVLPVCKFLWLKSTLCPLETSVNMSKPGMDHLGLMLLFPGTVLSVWAFVSPAGGRLGRQEASLSPSHSTKKGGAFCELAVREIHISSISRNDISNAAQRIPLRNLGTNSSASSLSSMISKKPLQVLAVGSRWGTAYWVSGWTGHPSEMGVAETLQVQPQTQQISYTG